MTMEQLLVLMDNLGMVDLGDAVTYLDEEGAIEALFTAEEKEAATSTPHKNERQRGSLDG